MKTLEQFVENYGSIPASTVWYLTFLAEAKGKQQLFLKGWYDKMFGKRSRGALDKKEVIPLKEGNREGNVYRVQRTSKQVCSRGGALASLFTVFNVW